MGKYVEAEKLYRQSLAMRRKLFGDEHPGVACSLHNLAGVLDEQGKLDETRSFAEELLANQRKQTEKPSASVDDLNDYAWELLTIEQADLRDPKTALPFARKAVEKSGSKDPSILDTLALAQQMTGDIDAAVETETKAVALLPAGPSALRSDLESSLAKYLFEQKRYAKAEPGKDYHKKANEWRAKLASLKTKPPPEDGE